MAFKLLAMAERRWRRVNAPQLVPLVRAGVSYADGIPVERGARRAARPSSGRTELLERVDCARIAPPGYQI